MREIKGLREVAEASRKNFESVPYKWMPIYFNFKTWSVSTDPDEGGFEVTELIRPNTEKEIEMTIRRWMAM